MLKTNSKQARENIRAYISEGAGEYVEDGLNLATWHNIAVYIWEDFNRVYDNIPAYKRNEQLFVDYSRGLPLWIGDIWYTDYHRAEQVLAGILEETPAEVEYIKLRSYPQRRLTENERDYLFRERCADLLMRLIYREIVKEAKNENYL